VSFWTPNLPLTYIEKGASIRLLKCLDLFSGTAKISETFIHSKFYIMPMFVVILNIAAKFGIPIKSHIQRN
jgi:hypothetical protein